MFSSPQIAVQAVCSSLDEANRVIPGTALAAASPILAKAAIALPIVSPLEPGLFMSLINSGTAGAASFPRLPNSLMTQLACHASRSIFTKRRVSAFAVNDCRL
jgi:hypothetical protein